MSDGRIDSIILKQAIAAEVSALNSDIDQLAGKIKSFPQIKSLFEGADNLKKVVTAQKEFAAGADSMDAITQRVSARIVQLNGQSKELADQILKEAKATKELSTAKLNDAKASTEAAKAKKIESTERGKSAAATEKEAAAAAKLREPYNQLVLRFNAAAREAKNLAAQYGILDPRAQAAAKQANALNNELKNIDASIGNHQRNVGNYASAWDGAKVKINEVLNLILSFVGITAGIAFFKDSIDQFLQLDKSLRLLENTTKNLGIPELFGRLERRTHDLGEQFKFLKQEDISSTFNKLLIYGKLSEKQINELIPVIINLATQTGQTLPEATTVLLKSLEGNNRGLREFGINVKAAHSVTERFKIIMEELKPRIDGVAEAFGGSNAGKIAIAKEEFRKLKEEVGERLTPVLAGLLSAVNKIIIGLGFLKDKLAETTLDVIDFFSGVQGMANKAIRDIEKERIVEKRTAGEIIDTFRDKTPLEIGEEIVKVQVRIGEFNKLLEIAKKNSQGTFSKDDVERYQRAVRIANLELKGLFDLNFSNKNKPIGLGNPDGGTGGSDPNTKFNKDLEDRFKVFELEKKREIDFAKDIFENEKASFGDRIQALETFLLQSKLLVDGELEFEKQKRGQTGAEINLAEEKRLDGLLRANHEFFKKLSEIISKETESLRPKLQDFTKEMDKMADRINKGILDSSDKFLKDQQALEKELEKLRNKLKELRLEFSVLTGPQALFAVGSGLFDAQKNRIQGQIDDIDRLKEADIARITASSDAEEKKAAKIKIVEAKAQSDHEVLQRRQREIDQKKAIFDRAANAFRITADGIIAVNKIKLEAAVAVNPAIKALLLAQIPWAIATTAASLVALFAQPIPKFWTGIDSSPEGPAIVAERGRELAIDPHGKLTLYQKPGLTNLMKGTKIFPNQVTEDIINNAHSQHRAMFHLFQQPNTNNNNHLLEEQNRILKRLEDKPATIINIHENASWNAYIEQQIKR